jgi:Icc protein
VSILFRATVKNLLREKDMSLLRRDFLKSLAGAGAMMALPRFPASAISAPGSFDFVFFTDTHIESELNASVGCNMCFDRISSVQPEFAIMGGDHVFDALGVNRDRAEAIFDLYDRTEQLLQMPLYHAIGNHDVFGVLTRSGAVPADPSYGKKMYQDRMGRTFYSFDHKGYHFVVLDSVQPTEDRLWEARVDAEELLWLAADLKRLPPGTPVIVVTHCPLVTAFQSYVEIFAARRKYNTLTVDNAAEVHAAMECANVIAVLQGHTHVNEVITSKNTQYITSGAVCGNWWQGPRLGTPEGFTIVSLRAGKVSSQYETYGFRSVDLHDGLK